MPKNKTALRLTESAMMLAVATVLSFVKLVDLPAGGSITLASMLPILLIAYRYGTAWGILCGFVHGAIQLALGSSALSYVTGWISAVAVIVLDYAVAFAVIGLGGAFRRMSSQRSAVLLGAVLVSVLRYACHVISGATVWAGLSIPSADALSYSFIYNATYMLPEMLILAVVAYYVTSSLDFASPRLSPVKRESASPVSRVLNALSGAILAGAGIFDIAAVFSKLQNPDSGEFDVTAITAVAWGWVAGVSLAAVALSLILWFIGKRVSPKKQG